MLSHREEAPRARGRRAPRSHVAEAVPQQRRGVQSPQPAPLPPATDPLSEHAQRGRPVPRRSGSAARVFPASLEAGLVPALGADRRGSATPDHH